MAHASGPGCEESPACSHARRTTCGAPRSASMDVSALPQALQLAVFALLPLHERLRCRLCVCRGWREMLRAPALWSALDFSTVPENVLTPDFLRAVLVLTAGGVRELRMWRAAPLDDDEALLGFLAANTGTLRHLNVTPLQRHEAFGVTDGHFTADELKTLLRAAPSLQRLDASMTEDSEYTAGGPRVCAVLSGEPPFGPLRLRELRLAFGYTPEPDLPALPCAMAAAPHACDVRALVIRRRPGYTGAALAALLDMVAACTRLATLHFEGCYLIGDCCAPLAAMVARCDAVEELVLDASGTVSLFHRYQLVPNDADYASHGAKRAGFAALCAALRSRPKLRAFALGGVALMDAAVATRVFVSTLGECPHLEELRFVNLHLLDREDEDNEMGVALCAALAELLMSSSSIAALRLINCTLTDAAMETVLMALEHAPSLRCLEWREGEREFDQEERSDDDDDDDPSALRCVSSSAQAAVTCDGDVELQAPRKRNCR